MTYRTHFPLAILVALVLTAVYWGCDRMTGEATPNQAPVVEFVNVPFNQDSFNYAPTIYWTGYDPDGMVTLYEYYDDTSPEAVNAARNNDTTALRRHIAALPDSVWTSSLRTYAVVYLRRFETEELTEHVFVVRCTDDQGMKSAAQYRTFFRSNQPPYAPQVKWALDSELDTPQDYQIDYVVPDTLFWGDTLTTTYSGIGFLWKGSDPDSRELNIIPLTFQWLLVNLTAPGGPDTVAHPVYDDSNRVVGWQKGGWSQWTSSTQMTFYGHYGARDTSEYLQSGRYVFRVRVRDDGLTVSDTMASVYFTAVKPTFDREVLIVDENKEPSQTDLNRGLLPRRRIVDFYRNVIPVAFEYANAWRLEDPRTYPEPFVYNPDEAWAFANIDLSQGKRIPYDLIGRYRWVWVINDNPPQSPEYSGVIARQAVMAAYLNVGGQVWLSGRRLFQGAYGIATQGDLNAARPAERFFITYFGLRSVYAKGLYNPGTGDLADFGAARSSEFLLPDSLRLLRSVVDSLRYRGAPVVCLPEIDYFGRSNAPTGTAWSTTVFNYSSCTQDTGVASPRAENIDCEVGASTPSQAWLIPARGHTRILQADTIYNVTKNVYGEFMYVTLVGSGRNSDDWRIVASTPASAGAWSTLDVLQVDYNYIPVAESNDEPVATNYQNFESVITSLDSAGARIRAEVQTRYRTSLYTFPLSFMDTTATLQYPLNPVAAVIAYQILVFNSPKSFEYRFGGGD